MNYREMFEWHREHHADITIATIQVLPEEADRFGVAEIDSRLPHRGLRREAAARQSGARRVSIRRW